jgi:hypothetical protein
MSLEEPNVAVHIQSLSENSKGPCFRGKGRMARRDEGAYPPAVCNRGATKPVGPFRENPPGDGSFGLGLRWLGRYSPLRGCAGLAALAQAKIPRRRTPSNFQTGSKGLVDGFGRLHRLLSLHYARSRR